MLNESQFNHIKLDLRENINIVSILLDIVYVVYKLL